MKSARFAIVAAFAMALVAACFSSTAVRAKETDAQLKPLQGGWKVTTLYVDGKKLTGADVEGMKLVIEGDKMTLTKMDRVLPVANPKEATFSIDRDKDTMDIHVGGETVLALYSCGDIELTLCLSKTPKATRPERLGTHDGQMIVLLAKDPK